VFSQRLQRYLCATIVTLLFSLSRVEAATSTLLDLNFNTTTTGYPAWGSTALTGSPGNGVSTIIPTTSNSGLFPTAPTSGYLAMTPNASAVTALTYHNGWAANVTFDTINSPYTAGGLGQSDASKISLTAKIRARGMPANTGAVVILKIQATGDDPGAVSGYKRIMFEPTFLAGNDWTTVGGTFDTAGLTAAKGTTYNFPYNAATYTVLIEASGFNRYGTAGYVAYANNPTVAASGGRKNPGFDLTASAIRIEIDDVKLVVTDPATTGYAAPTTPAQLLRNGNFSNGEGNWAVFEGAEVNSTDPWNEESGDANSGSGAFMIIPGWKGSAYAGFMQNQIAFNSANGDYFTASFRAKFETNYKSDSTIVAFMDAGATTELYVANLAEEISQNLGQWHTYRASFKASTSQLATLNGKMTLKIQPIGRTATGVEFSSALIDNVVLSQVTSASVGPQIGVRLNSATQTDNGSTVLVSPPVGRPTTYSLKLANTGAENLIINSITLSGSSISLVSATLPATIIPGGTQTFSLTTTPSSITSIASILTINSNDKDTADQAFVVNLSATPVNLTESFNASETPTQLGWSSVASTAGLLGASSLTTAGGELVLSVNSAGDTWPWSYSISKTFVSPGVLDLSASSLLVALKASGVYQGSGDNKVQIRLESLNSAQFVTGSIQLGTWVDETTANSVAPLDAYFKGDGINDRVVVYVPENSPFLPLGSTRPSTHPLPTIASSSK